MSDSRIHFASLMVGMKATGKSTKLAAIARTYPTDRKVLIIDVNGSPAYNEFTSIKYQDLPRFTKPGKAKIYGVPDEAELILIAEHFRNGLVVFEDCTSYISANPPKQVTKFLVNHRMMGCDLLFTFHSIVMVPPSFWKLVSYVIICKTQEYLDPKPTKSNLTRYPNFEQLCAAYNRVKANKDRYYSETIETYTI